MRICSGPQSLLRLLLMCSLVYQLLFGKGTQALLPWGGNSGPSPERKAEIETRRNVT